MYLQARKQSKISYQNFCPTLYNYVHQYRIGRVIDIGNIDEKNNTVSITEFEAEACFFNSIENIPHLRIQLKRELTAVSQTSPCAFHYRIL